MAAWAALLLGLALFTRGEATVPQQASTVAARPYVDRAISTVLHAAGADTAVSVGGYDRVGSCDVSVARSGVKYRRAADLYSVTGSTSLLNRIRAGLPSEYKPSQLGFAPHPKGLILAQTGKAAGFVKVTVTPAKGDDGHLRLVVDTTCRPAAGTPYPELLPAPSESERSGVAAVFTALSAAPSDWRRYRVDCADGSTRTVSARGKLDSSHGTAAMAALPAALRSAGVLPANAHPLSTSDTRFAWRSGDTSLVAVRSGDRVDVVSTVSCR